MRDNAITDVPQFLRPAISKQKAPLGRDSLGRSLVTRSSLASDLANIGIGVGDTVCVHTSLSSLGYVCGGALTVIDALSDAVGSDGTIMMPTFSGEMSDPAAWRSPSVPDEWCERIRQEMPPYDPAVTPTRLMGAVAELFRTVPGTLRSSHPQSSFSARGKRSSDIVIDHQMAYRFGPRSPLGKLAALDGKIMLLGADTRRGSFIYLAQVMSGLGPEIIRKVPVPAADSRNAWCEFADVRYDNQLVQSGIEYLIKTGVASLGSVGDASTVVFSSRSALKALLDWRWSTSDVPHAVERPPMELPNTWGDWLEPRGNAE